MSCRVERENIQEPLAMSVVVTPSARETFMPHELTAAYKDFTKRGPEYSNGETGLRAATYRFGVRVLIVYEESETGVVVLMSDSRILDNPPLTLPPY